MNCSGAEEITEIIGEDFTDLTETIEKVLELLEKWDIKNLLFRFWVVIGI